MGLSSEASRLFAIICRETQGEAHSVTRARITLLAAGEMTEIEAENSLTELAGHSYISFSDEWITRTAECPDTE
ncbi:MAG TPA: hypothetical protein VN714_17380 [Trebonia sp.]|jgi:hypothetical protein|nr:hypothetical protein [Trebonia sp.]